MEWTEVTPEQDDWVKQIDVMAYYGGIKVGSIIRDDEGYWQSCINGYLDDLCASTLEEAKEEMIDALEREFESQISYYEDLTKMLGELKSKEGTQ